MISSLATCIGRAIVLSVAMIATAWMYVTGIDDWRIAVMFMFGLGSSLLIPTYKTINGKVSL